MIMQYSFSLQATNPSWPIGGHMRPQAMPKPFRTLLYTMRLLLADFMNSAANVPQPPAPGFFT